MNLNELPMLLLLVGYLYLFLTRKNRRYLEVSNLEHYFLWKKYDEDYRLEVNGRLYVTSCERHGADNSDMWWHYTVSCNGRIFLDSLSGDPRAQQVYEHAGRSVAERVQEEDNILRRLTAGLALVASVAAEEYEEWRLEEDSALLYQYN